MEFTFTYILSQILTILMYILLAITYQIKNRKYILALSIFSQVLQGGAYLLLNAYTALAMCIIAVIRDTISIIDDNKNGKRDRINKKDIIIFIILNVLIVIATIITWDSWYSLLSAVATMIFTYSIWQKNVKIYKVLGIPVGLLWIIYNFIYKSIFGVILETFLLIASIRGVVTMYRKMK